MFRSHQSSMSQFIIQTPLILLSMTGSYFHKINTLNLQVRVSFQGNPFNLVGSKVKYFKITLSFIAQYMPQNQTCSFKIKFKLNICRCLNTFCLMID